MFRIITFLLILLFPSIVVAANTTDFDHSDWNDLLQQYVIAIDEGKVTQVDYSGFKEKRDDLKAYLKALSEVSVKEFGAWSKDEQLAFLINAYNSWTVELILSKYPDLTSIKDLGSFLRSPWKKKFIPLLEETRSLNDIEHGLIRGSGKYNDPRIHFAVNCASIGCPALRGEAYQGKVLQQQLEEATTLFLSDSTRNRLSGDGKSLEVSSIFKWYQEDFEKGDLGVTSLKQFFLTRSKYLGLSSEEQKELETGRLKIKFLAYDWKLNGT